MLKIFNKIIKKINAKNSPIFILDNNDDFLIFNHNNFYHSKSIEIKNKFYQHADIFLLLNFEKATTIYTILNLKLGSTIEDFDNHLFNLLWLKLNEFRNRSAAKMKVKDSELVLYNATVKKIIVDNKVVENLNDCLNKKVMIEMQVTFITRKLLPLVLELKENFNRLFIFENGAVLTSLLDKFYNIVLVTQNQTLVYKFENNNLFFGGILTNSYNKLINNIQELLGVNNQIADLILQKSISMVFSERVNKVFNNLWSQWFKEIFVSIKNSKLLVDGSKYKIFFNHAIPKHLALKVFKTSFVDLSNIYLPNSLQLKYENPILEAAIIENETKNNYDNINKLIQRRIKWLTP
ncbi:MAG: hypothetical protein ACP5IC_00710 [Minisyncoccia bacterium]